MSIYATLWTLKFPFEGDETLDCDWITVRAQAVPPHIGTPSPGHGYEGGDPYAGFFPPPVAVDAEGAAPHDRAVVFVTEHSIKGTEVDPQQYVAPLPGEIATVKPRKQWSYAGHPYLSGEIESTRLDVPALGLVPLRLEKRGVWNPDEHYWGEEDESVEEWARPIIAQGPRPEFVMEQTLPGAGPADIDSDPIIESNDRKDAGDRNGAYRILMDLCQADLRCLDAHAHLGNLAFDYSPKDAFRHYDVGVRIGELSLGQQFDGLLPWGYIDNRPFLRCLSGLGLCLWRLERFQEAERVFNRMLWLVPPSRSPVPR